MTFLNETCFNLPSHVANPVKAFLSERFVRMLRAVYLTGSWASKTAIPSSDIDLFVIVDEDKSVNQTRAEIRQWLRRTQVSRASNRNLRIDLKCLSLTELRSAYHSDQHFAVWARLSTAILLMGSEMREEFPLKNRLLKVALERRLDEIDEVFVLTSKRVSFEYASVLTVNCLKTLYFILTYILKQKIKAQPRKWISDKLEPISKPIIDVYDKLAHRGIEMLGPLVCLRTGRSNPNKYSANLYCAFAEKSNDIMCLGNDIYRRVSRDFSDF